MDNLNREYESFIIKKQLSLKIIKNNPLCVLNYA
ncbi:hypothetical protein J2Y40_003841 [Chryseobacterium sp. 2987]|nr:hypothetical protein [Chryseobacterium sp. 2987]